MYLPHVHPYPLCMCIFYTLSPIKNEAITNRKLSNILIQLHKTHAMGVITRLSDSSQLVDAATHHERLCNFKTLGYTYVFTSTFIFTSQTKIVNQNK